MIKVDGLCRSYGELKAVDQVSFQIDKGEIVGLLGHNGAGKTTIMKLLSGFLEPDKGNIEIGGQNIAGHMQNVKKHLGYLPENLPLYQDMTVADYLDYTASLKGLEGDNKKGDIRRVVQATDIGEKFLAPIATLSRGLKQRTGVAQALLGKPKMLILDEPTNGLDPTQTEHMRQLIRDIAQQATVIISTHIMQEVEAICDRVLIMKNGKLAVDAKLQDLKYISSLSVQSNLDSASLRSTLETLDNIESVGEIISKPPGRREGAKSCRIVLKSGSHPEEVAAEIAKRLITEGARLYALHPIVRNLETLFQEVSEEAEPEVDNAA